MQRKWKQWKGREMAFDETLLPLVSPKAPTQTNGCDCGMYVLRYVKASHRGAYFNLYQLWLLVIF